MRRRISIFHAVVACWDETALTVRVAAFALEKNVVLVVDVK
jgi:hypothetical protein